MIQVMYYKVKGTATKARFDLWSQAKRLSIYW